MTIPVFTPCFYQLLQICNYTRHTFVIINNSKPFCKTIYFIIFALFYFIACSLSIFSDVAPVYINIEEVVINVIEARIETNKIFAFLFFSTLCTMCSMVIFSTLLLYIYCVHPTLTIPPHSTPTR